MGESGLRATCAAYRSSRTTRRNHILVGATTTRRGECINASYFKGETKMIEAVADLESAAPFSFSRYYAVEQLERESADAYE